MTKLSKTQQELLNVLKNDIEVMNRYQTFEEFFDNAKCGETQYSVAKHFNGKYNSSEKYSMNDPEEFEEMRRKFYRCRDEHITICRANTKTVERLVKEGFIQIVRAQEWVGGFELVKVL